MTIDHIDKRINLFSQLMDVIQIQSTSDCSHEHETHVETKIFHRLLLVRAEDKLRLDYEYDSYKAYNSQTQTYGV